MKRIIFLFSMFLISASLYGQVEPCHLQGPGSADGGTDPANCNITANYSFQDQNNNVCVPSGNSQSSWSWCIDNLGSPGFINLNQNTSFPLTFTMGNGVTATIVGASYTSITIQYDCGDCNTDVGQVSHFNIFFGCNNEIYQSSVFVACDDGTIDPPPPPKPCETDTYFCVETDCDCIKICVDGVQYIIQDPTPNTNDSQFFCIEATEFGTIYDCDEDVPCKVKPGKNVKIPTARFEKNLLQATTSFSLELSDNSAPYELILTNISGQVFHQESISRNRVDIQIGSLDKGIYIVNLKNGNTIINHKFIIK